MDDVIILHNKIINSFNSQSSSISLTLSKNEILNLYSILIAAVNDVLPEYDALEDKINIVYDEIEVICKNVSLLEKPRNKLH